MRTFRLGVLLFGLLPLAISACASGPVSTDPPPAGGDLGAPPNTCSPLDTLGWFVEAKPPSTVRFEGCKTLLSLRDGMPVYIGKQADTKVGEKLILHAEFTTKCLSNGTLALSFIDDDGTFGKALGQVRSGILDTDAIARKPQTKYVIAALSELSCDVTIENVISLAQTVQ